MTKSSILKFSLIAAVLALASTPSTVQAQTANHKLAFNVPFAFEIGTVHFAPGTYTLGQLNESTLAVQGKGNAAAASSRQEDVKYIAASKVVFRRIGDRYFLGEVWNAPYATHTVVYETKQEKQARQVLLAGNPASAPDTVIALATAK